MTASVVARWCHLVVDRSCLTAWRPSRGRAPASSSCPATHGHRSHALSAVTAALCSRAGVVGGSAALGRSWWIGMRIILPARKATAMQVSEDFLTYPGVSANITSSSRRRYSCGHISSISMPMELEKKSMQAPVKGVNFVLIRKNAKSTLACYSCLV